MDDESLRRLVRARTHGVPDTRSGCPSPETLQATATSAGDAPLRFAVLEHVATCAPCRRDFDLLRTAHAAAPPARRLTLPRWIPAAAAAAVIAVASVVALREPADTMRGRGPDTPPGVELLAPTRLATGLGLRWRSVADAVTYRVEVTDDDGNLAFSAETSDTTVVAPVQGNAALRWAVEARRLDGTVLTSRLDALTVPR